MAALCSNFVVIQVLKNKIAVILWLCYCIKQTFGQTYTPWKERITALSSPRLGVFRATRGKMIRGGIGVHCRFVLSCWLSLKDPACILMIALFGIWLILYLGFDLTSFSPSLGSSKSRFWISALLVSIRNAIVCRRTARSLGPNALASDSTDYHQRPVMNNQRKLQWRGAFKVRKVSFLFRRIKVSWEM